MQSQRWKQRERKVFEGSEHPGWWWLKLKLKLKDRAKAGGKAKRVSRDLALFNMRARVGPFLRLSSPWTTISSSSWLFLSFMPVSTPRPRPCHPTPATSSQKLSSAKRARSPEPPILDPLSSKRLKPAFSSNVREDTKKDKDRKRTEREREFRVKYTRAFPSWIFYFDIDDLSQDKLALRDRLQRGVLELGAVCIL